MLLGAAFADAWARARRAYPNAAHFQRAYVKGAQAASNGRPQRACPYRSAGGWAAWRAAWMQGWASIERDVEP